MNDPQEMMAAYFEGQLTAEQVAELEAWARADSQHARTLARAAMLDCHLTELLREQNLEDVAADLSEDTQFGALVKEIDASSHGSEVGIINQAAARPSTPSLQARTGQAATFREVLDIAGYLAFRGLRTRPGVIAMTAAVVLIGVLLYTTIFGGDSTQPAPSPITRAPAPAYAPELRPVAKLTAERNAVWDRRPGQDLYAGQRFTLTQGAAEITTNQGALALLQAPCTIALTFDDNTLLLDQGRLIGRCTTPESRGFVVLTPDAKVTDIGTEFGVFAEAERGTRVQVFDGEVRVATNQASDQPRQTLSVFSQQAVLIPPDSGSLVRVDFDESVFSLRPVEHLDVVDIVAGGNGLGRRSGMAINLATGQYLTSEQIATIQRQAWSHDNGMTINPIEQSHFVDCVFIIDRLTGRAEITSEGGEFDDFPTMPDTIHSGDANGFIQATPANTVVNPPSLADHQRPFAQVGREDLDGRYVVIHGGAGITFDLQAIKQRHQGFNLERFHTFALNIEEQSRAISPAPVPATADLWVIVDGETRFVRRSIDSKDGAIELDIALEEDDRFLTIAVSHGGDGTFHDWVIFSKAKIQGSYRDGGTTE
ncbi:MAG: FecR domain-containing protein [Planctomycetota bacterium]